MIKMSKRESLICKINENVQRIELLKLIDDKNNKTDKTTIIHLENENTKLKNMLLKLKIEEE